MKNIELGTKLGIYTVIGITTIQHGKYFTNTRINSRILVSGSRNTKYEGYVYQDGTFDIIKTTNYNKVDWLPWCKEGVWVYDGINGQFVEPIATVSVDEDSEEYKAEMFEEGRQSYLSGKLAAPAQNLRFVEMLQEVGAQIGDGWLNLLAEAFKSGFESEREKVMRVKFPELYQ